MSEEAKDFVLGLYVGAIVSAFIALVIVAYMPRNDDAEAIKRGYKLYDTKTGELKWKEPDDAK